MKTLLLPLLLAALVAPAVLAQPKKADARTLARLEKKLVEAEQVFSRDQHALRTVYRDLEQVLGSPTEKEQARIVAELGRILEPVITKAKRMGGGSRAKRKKLTDHFKKALPTALANLEDVALKRLSVYLEKRLLAVTQEGRQIDDALALSHDQWAKRGVKDLLDTNQDFHERWNDLISDVLPEAREFSTAHKNRKKANQNLKVARDPLLLYQIDAPAGFAKVPSGTYIQNNSAGFGGEGIRKGNKKFNLARGAYVGLREVTNREYQAWLSKLGDDVARPHLPRDPAGKSILWTRHAETKVWTPPEEQLDYPVTGIRLASALAYAASVGARLPTEREWCACAGGTKGLQYPWANEWADGACNSKESALGEPVRVGSFEDGRGPFGHYDLAGNVMEWTLTYESGKRIEPENIDDVGAVIRGGSFKHGQRDVVTGWVWYRRARFDQDSNLGFRLARDL